VFFDAPANHVTHEPATFWHRQALLAFDESSQSRDDESWWDASTALSANEAPHGTSQRLFIQRVCSECR
jgi:hypothetical protein